jgi:hypothetical protein
LRLEGRGRLKKNPMTLSGIEPTTFQLVAKTEKKRNKERKNKGKTNIERSKQINKMKTYKIGK